MNQSAIWKPLYRASAVAALTAAKLIRRNIGAEVSFFTGIETILAHAADWFSLLQSNPFVGLSFMTLSDQYASASSEGAKTILLGAGEAILASDLWHGSGAIIGGLILQTGLLFISLFILSSRVFSKLTAWLGILTHGLDLLHILVAFFLPVRGVALMMVAGPLYLVWLPLLARDFFRLGWRTPGLQETI